MTEFKRLMMIFVTTPFLVVGAIWQVIAGGFMAGRIMMTQWTHNLGREVLLARLGADVEAGLAEVAKAKEPAAKKSRAKGLH